MFGFYLALFNRPWGHEKKLQKKSTTESVIVWDEAQDITSYLLAETGNRGLCLCLETPVLPVSILKVFEMFNG